MNPMMIMSMLKQGGNPQAMAMQLLQQSNNPLANNALQMMNNGDSKGIENMVRNLCKEKGINPDDMLKQVMGNLK